MGKTNEPEISADSVEIVEGLDGEPEGLLVGLPLATYSLAGQPDDDEDGGPDDPR